MLREGLARIIKLFSRFLFILKYKWRKKPRREGRFEYQMRYNSFDIQPGEIVLDVGSGHHPFPMATILVDAHVEPTVHRRAHLATDNRPLVIADIHYLPFKDKTIDFVYCSHILEHVDDPEKSCREVCRVGGRGYIETPNFMKDVLFSWAEGMHKWYTVAINDELHFFEYTERQAKGIQSALWEEIILGRKHHKMQDVFYDNQDLFNTMFMWEGSFTPVVHRWRV